MDDATRATDVTGTPPPKPLGVMTDLEVDKALRERIEAMGPEDRRLLLIAIANGAPRS